MPSHHEPARRDDAPLLRLFAPDESHSNSLKVSAEMTLSELFEVDFLPLWIRAKNLDPKTETTYRDALAWWERLTGDPPLSSIDDHTVARFQQQLFQQRGRQGGTLSSHTVRKHSASINKLLSFAGPKGPDRRSRKNRGLLEDPPFVDAPEVDKPAPSGDFTLQQIRTLYRAAEGMTRPCIPGVRPVWWWRSILVVAYYTGFRRNHLLDMEFSQIVVPWFNGGQVTVLPRSGKRRRGYHGYLPTVALEHVERIRTDRERVFEWTVCMRQLTHHFDKWLRLAGMADRIRRGDKFHGFRKTHATILAAMDPDQTVRIAQASAGHEKASTTLDHYIRGGVSEIALARAIDAMPSPVPTDFQERQRLLF